MLSRVSSSWSALHQYQFHTCLCPPLHIAIGYQESVFVGWKVYSSSTNKAKKYSYSIFVQQMYWLQDNDIYLCWKIQIVLFNYDILWWQTRGTESSHKNRSVTLSLDIYSEKSHDTLKSRMYWTCIVKLSNRCTISIRIITSKAMKYTPVVHLYHKYLNWS